MSRPIPRNLKWPFLPKIWRQLTSEQILIDYLYQTASRLKHLIDVPEPMMTDKMTYFAYLYFLWICFGVGDYPQMKDNKLNPWLGGNPPVDFYCYCQVKKLPEELETIYKQVLDAQNHPQPATLIEDEQETNAIAVVSDGI